MDERKVIIVAKIEALIKARAGITDQIAGLESSLRDLERPRTASVHSRPDADKGPDFGF